jgi:hypothetical protein
MIEYRVTKYNPALRDAHGGYTADDWILFQQIGSSFGGVVLTEGEYLKVEQAYVNSAIAFLREGGLDSLIVEALENHKRLPLEFCEGSTLSLEAVGDVIRQMLREELWCRLESNSGFVHIGWDFYM